jgi:hypothetical protein
MITSFDPQMAPSLFKGEFTKLEVIDPVPLSPPMVGNLIIDPSQDFTIEVQWTLTGFFVPLWLAALGGNWVVEAYADSIGPGDETRIADATVSVGTPSDPMVYSVPLVVKKNTLKGHVSGPTGPSGIYRLTVSAFLDSTLGSPGYDIVGFAEGVTIRAENPI